MKHQPLKVYESIKNSHEIKTKEHVRGSPPVGKHWHNLCSPSYLLEQRDSEVPDRVIHIAAEKPLNKDQGSARIETKANHRAANRQYLRQLGWGKVGRLTITKYNQCKLRVTSSEDRTIGLFDSNFCLSDIEFLSLSVRVVG